MHALPRFGRSAITISAPISPAIAAPRVLRDIYGSDVAVCARPALDVGEPVLQHRLGRDVLSARPLAIAADTPLICSAGGTDPSLLAALRDGGLPVGTDLREFRTEAEFADRVREALAEGLQLAMEYPHAVTLCPDLRAVKSAELVGHLNNKASISTLVDPRFRAGRTLVSRADLVDATRVERSWVLKAATNDAHGASLDVYLHRAGEPVVLPGFTDLLDAFVIEEYLQIRRNWGIQLYVAPDATARLLAVTEQRIDAAGIYTGGRFGLFDAPPAELLAECVTVTQRAADAGYRGVCSLDCAETFDGRLVLLDLNFRITSGSIPLLALQAVRPDALDHPAESLMVSTPAPLADMLAALRSATAAGGLLISAGHSSVRTDNPVKRSTLQLLVFGEDPDDVTARRLALESMFRPVDRG